MSTPHSNLPGQAGNAAEVDRLLQEAETAATAEDWDKTIETYRTLLTFDRVIQGAEAKLQWALRMRDIDALYRQGKTELEVQHYTEALAALRKARLMYASHYKDTDALIVEAQTAMQKGNWQARPQAATAKKGCLLTGGALTLLAVLSIILLNACAPAPATPTAINIPTAPAAPTVAAAAPPSTSGGSAALHRGAGRVAESAPDVRKSLQRY
jgi:hypothetical protein